LIVLRQRGNDNLCPLFAHFLSDFWQALCKQLGCIRFSVGMYLQDSITSNNH
jgi:hypothetical protein